MKLAPFATVASTALFVAMATTASAAVRSVDISGFAFVPQSVTITVGDTVTWTNRDAAAHSARVNGVGTTAVLTQGQSGSLSFVNAGTFPYDCGLHGSSMTGTVVVRAAATAPPTQAPTPVPTVIRTVAPTPIPSPSPTASAVATLAASGTAAPTVAVDASTQQAPAPAGGNIDLTVLAFIAVTVLVAVAAAVLRRSRAG